MKIITGASRGIGKYLLEKYADVGEEVYGTFFSTEPTHPYHKELYSRVDVSSYREVDEWVKSIPVANNTELLNCAAINYNSFAHKADPDKWEWLIGVNLVGVFNITRAILPRMRENNYGRIINFSSVVDRLGIPGTSAYASSKAGLLGLTGVLATENASRGITVNNINLGYFSIGMGLNVPLNFSETIKDRIPSGKFGDPKTIFNAVNFLIENSYINGASLDIDGGLR